MDTPALSEALKTTERKLQIAEQLHPSFLGLPLDGLGGSPGLTVAFLNISALPLSVFHGNPCTCMGITKCRICDSLCASWSSTVRCGSCASSRTCDLKARWISLSDSRRDQQRIEIEYDFSASLHEMDVLGSTHVVVCDRGLDMYTTTRRGMRRTRRRFQCCQQNCEHAGVCATSAKSRRASSAIHTGETAHARVEPEREPKVHVAPRENEEKQQQDWMLVFVDNPETFQDHRLHGRTHDHARMLP